jgi:hypothetical protein
MRIEIRGVLQKFERMNTGRIYPEDAYRRYAARIIPDIRMKRIETIFNLADERFESRR